jgi:lysylphosphatidylglycerol synthetase-like protein (DUF2156 family)
MTMMTTMTTMTTVTTMTTTMITTSGALPHNESSTSLRLWLRWEVSHDSFCAFSSLFCGIVVMFIAPGGPPRD